MLEELRAASFHAAPSLACGALRLLASLREVRLRSSFPLSSICDGNALERLIDRLADDIAAAHRCGTPLALVGIRTRGVPLAERLAQRIEKSIGESVAVGSVDTTMYRDDLEHHGRLPVLRGTDIPFEVDGAEIVLVDDVLYTGRSARAALNTVCDLGRPACVRLAVAVDRRGRELPIQADYVGMTIEAEPSDRIIVQLRPVDPADEIVRINDAG
jgi:pyrimidine operon attenuation protein/uracil phosphoribosyltransferase